MDFSFGAGEWEDEGQTTFFLPPYYGGYGLSNASPLCGRRRGEMYTHVDISNCYWGFVLPKRFWDLFRYFFQCLGGRGRGNNFDLEVVIFGWKYSPVLCQRVLQYFVKGLKKGHTLILHY